MLNFNVMFKFTQKKRDYQFYNIDSHTIRQYSYFKKQPKQLLARSESVNSPILQRTCP